MRRACLTALVAGCFIHAGIAHGQTRDDLARAEALFNAGKALTDSGQYVDACAKFAESKRLAPGLGVTLYLADCYERIGRTASAWTEFRSAEGLARERNDKRSEVARARAQALEPKLGRLTISVSPVIARAGLQVLRDGVPVSQDELGMPLPADPGDHVVVVSSPGHKARTWTVHVGPESPTVQVDTLDEASPEPAPSPTPTPTPAPSPAPAAAPEVAPTSPSAPEDPGSTRRWIGLGLGGLGLVGIGVGSVLGVTAMSKRDQSNNGPCDAANKCSPDGLTLRQDALHAADASTIAFIAGGVAVAAGVVLFVTAPRATSSTGIVVAPVPFAGGGGALVRGGF
jgi:hypothetical protein